MTKEQEEAIERINNDIATPLYCGDITICNIDDLKTILSMLEEKDKQIDLMAEFIAQTEIDEFICKNIENCIADDEYSNCYKCIEQYFENKVKEEIEKNGKNIKKLYR